MRNFKAKSAIALVFGILGIVIMAGMAAAEPVKENVDRSVVVYYETTILNAEQLREIENLDNKFSGGTSVYNRVLSGTPPRKVISLEDSVPLRAPSITKADNNAPVSQQCRPKGYVPPPYICKKYDQNNKRCNLDDAKQMNGAFRVCFRYDTKMCDTVRYACGSVTPSENEETF